MPVEEMAEPTREKGLRYVGKAGKDPSKVSTTKATNDSRNSRTSEPNPAVRGVYLKNRMR